MGSKEYGKPRDCGAKAVSEDVFCLGCATFQTYETLAEDPRHPSLAIASISSPDGVEYYLLHTWTSRSNDVLQFRAVSEVASIFLLVPSLHFSAERMHAPRNSVVHAVAVYCVVHASYLPQSILVTLNSPQSRSGGVQDGRDSPCLPDTRGANRCMEESIDAVTIEVGERDT
jgi:hypothetical protein